MRKPLTFVLLFASSSLGFLFLPEGHGVLSSPTVTGVVPRYGFTDLNTNIQIGGSNFQSGASVKIGQAAATSVTVLNATTLTAAVPYGSTAGTYDVTVTNPDGQFGVLAGGFEVVAPPNEWTKDTVNGLPSPTTSTCTILMPDNITHRTYFTGPGGILTYTSMDGKNWGDSTNTGITDIGGSNPSVIRLKDGTYMMIYGVQTANPMTERLYRATSINGITFTKQAGPLTGGAVLIADAGENDFVSVPDLVYLNDATLRMYFVASPISSRIHSATSTDNGRTWTREGHISISGGPIGGQENDPDVVALSDGTWRLFFATPPVGQQIGNLRIRSALSTDGRNFSLEPGSRMTPSGSVTVTMDPDVVLVPGTTDTYRMYFGVEPPGNLRSAVSVPTLPSPPTLSSPSDDAANQSQQLRLTWFASNQATSYGLQVSTSPSFTTTLFSQSAINDTSYTIGGLAYNTTYFWRARASNAGGTSGWSETWSFTTSVSTSAERIGEAVPIAYAFHQNFPNPFNPSTSFEFEIPSFGFVSLKIYNMLGREVAVLVDEQLRPGTYRLRWDAKGLASGVYFYRIHAMPKGGARSGELVQTKKLLLIK